MGRVVIIVTVSHIVKKLINNKKFLHEALQQDIVSYNSLAAKLKPEIEEELGKIVKLNAIVMAIRRYKENLDSYKSPSVRYFTELLMRTNICYIVVNESPALLPKLSTLYHQIDFRKGGILNIAHGSYQVGIVTNDKYREKLLDLLKMEDIVLVTSEVIMISLTYKKDFTYTPGVLYDVVRLINWENISILNVLHTPSDLYILVSDKDALRCYKTLDKLLNEKEKK